MYKYTDNTQSNFLDFNQPIGLHMNPKNRWVKMADAIPWEIFEKKYSRLFKGKNGRVAKPLRLALGSLIIQTKYQYSDRELVEQLTENPYYQYFIGLPGYQEERQKKKVYGRRWIRVATACIVCAVVAGGSLIGLRRSFLMSQNETSGSAPKTETASQEESLEIGKADQGDAVSGDVDASDAQEDGTAVSNQGKEEKESSQDSAGTEENTSASTGILTQKVDIKVLAVTPTSRK